MIYTLSQVINDLNIDTGSGDYSKQVVLLTSIVSESISEVDNYTNRYFTSGSHTERYNGSGDTMLYIRNPNITSVSSLQYLVWTTFQTLATDFINDIEIISDLNAVQLLNGFYYFYGNKNIKITYVSGYDYTNLPSSIKTFLREYSALLYWNMPLSSKQGRLGIQSKNDTNVIGYGTVYKDELTKLHTMYLDSFKWYSL